MLDLWSTFMKRAGWQEGEPLPGSRDVDNNKFLSDALLDGKVIPFPPKSH